MDDKFKLFCNNTSIPPVPFMYNQKMLKTKQLGNINYHHIQPTIWNIKTLMDNLL